MLLEHGDDWRAAEYDKPCAVRGHVVWDGDVGKDCSGPVGDAKPHARRSHIDPVARHDARFNDPTVSREKIQRVAVVPPPRSPPTRGRHALGSRLGPERTDEYFRPPGFVRDVREPLPVRRDGPLGVIRVTRHQWTIRAGGHVMTPDL